MQLGHFCGGAFLRFKHSWPLNLKIRIVTKQLGCLDKVQMKITLSRMIPLIQIDIGLDKNLIFYYSLLGKSHNCKMGNPTRNRSLFTISLLSKLNKPKPQYSHFLDPSSIPKSHCGLFNDSNRKRYLGLENS